jgi:hypothetical protein
LLFQLLKFGNPIFAVFNSEETAASAGISPHELYQLVLNIDLLSPHPLLLHDPVELTVKVLESLAEVNGQLWLLFQQVKRLQLGDVLLGCLSTLDVNNAVESLSETAVYGFLQVNLQHGSEELAFVLVL